MEAVSSLTHDNSAGPPDKIALSADKELLLRSRSGDLAAFDLLARPCYSVIYHLAYRMLGSREAAEDATQEVFLKAWKSIGNFRGDSRFLTWLHAIAIRHCLNDSKRLSLEAEKTRPYEAETPEPGERRRTEIEDWHLREEIRQALLRLPEKPRLAIALRYYSDYSVQEIAEMMNAPVRTIYAYLEKGRARLWEEMRRSAR
jgi:RNA polymerase sigma-70 factor (ECF subfamily)